jgi:hypothetical protein
MLKRWLQFAVLLVGILILSPALAQLPPKPPLPGKPPEALLLLQKLLGAKVADLDQAVRGMSAYPKRTRNAILDLAKAAEKNPTLLADLAKLRTEPAAAIDQYLTTKLDAETRQAAAIVLVEAPDSIAQLQERPDLAKLVGAAWSTPPGRDLITSALDGAGAAQEKARSGAADRWTARLKADPKLMQQYAKLLEDYTARNAGDKVDDSWKSYGYGTYKTQDSYVVEDVPSSEVINYALALGSQYQAVVAALIQQYLSGTNQDDYNAAVGGWYANNGSSIPASTRESNSDYYELLRELADLAQAAYANYNSGSDSGTGSSGGSGDGTGGYSNGYGDSYGSSAEANAASRLLAFNLNQYPKLANWKEKNPAPKLGALNDLPRLKDNPGSKPPAELGPNSKNPFADLMKNTPQDARARPMPAQAQNPFKLAAQTPKPNVNPKPTGAPQQLMRGNPPIGNQLGRAQGQMGSAFKPPRGGGGPRPK